MEPISFDNSYARLPETFFAQVGPAAVAAPALVRLNHRLMIEFFANSLGMPEVGVTV